MTSPATLPTTLIRPPSTPPAEPVAHPRPLGSLVAAAARLSATTLPKRGGTGALGWQEDAWDMFELVGEERFLGTTLAGRLSQARFYVGELDVATDEPVETEDTVVAGILSAIGDSKAAFAQMVERLGVNLFVAGDGYLAGIPSALMPHSQIDPAGLTIDPELVTLPPPPPLAGLNIEDLQWRMLSVSEVTANHAGQVSLHLGESVEDRVTCNPDEVFLVRVWRPHARRSWEADSPTRSCLPVLRELVGLTMKISAQIDSRLAGAGVFLIPQSAARAIKAAAGLPEDSPEDPFTESLIAAMVTPISDRASASAVVPLCVTVPDDAVAGFRFITFAQPADGDDATKRDEAIRRLALGQDAPPEVLLGTGGMNHWGCLLPDVEAYTRHGWKAFTDLIPGEDIRTLDHDTGLARWAPLTAVQTFDVVDAPMRSLATRSHSSVSTMNHRWPVVSHNGKRAWRTSETLHTDDRFQIAAPAAGLPSEAKWSDSYVQLAAWVATDAHLSRRGQLQIHQSHTRNPERVTAIRAALNDVFGPDGYTEKVQTNSTAYGGPITCFRLRAPARHSLVGNVLTPGTDPHDRLVSRAFIDTLTLAQLHLFIDVTLQADGRHYRRGERDLWLKNPEQLDAFEHAGILAGYATSRTQDGGGWQLTLLKSTHITPMRAAVVSAASTDEVVPYTGTVWCPTTPDGTWLARHNGRVFFTGNSWLVKEDVVSTHLEPILALICDALTTQYLWPVLMEQGMSEEDAHRFVIWYDVSDLIARPNRSQDAFALHAAGAIDDEALRDATGFDESGAPDLGKVPIEVTLALELVKAAPTLLVSPGLQQVVAQLAAVLAGDVPPVAAPAAQPAALTPADGTTAPPTGDGAPGGQGGPPAAGLPQTAGAPARPTPVGAPPAAAAATTSIGPNGRFTGTITNGSRF